MTMIHVGMAVSVECTEASGFCFKSLDGQALTAMRVEQRPEAFSISDPQGGLANGPEWAAPKNHRLPDTP